jgi:hypothetical protein
MRKLVISAVVAGSMVAGGAAGVLLGIPGVSHAADSTLTAGAQATTDATTATTAPSGAPGARTGPLNNAIDNALKGLVDNKTITQDQADAVKKALQDQLAAQPRKPGGPGGFGRFGLGLGGIAGAKSDVLGTASKMLGMTPDEITTQLRSGKSLADLATSKGIAPQKLIDAIVADANSRIDKAVTNNKLTADQASKIKGNLNQAVTNLVNNTMPLHGGGPRFRPGGPPPTGGNNNSGTNGSPTTKPASYTTA